jgi:FkbM family methyltransferase
MIIVSPIVDLAGRIGGPRFAHRIYLKRLARWRKLEAEYDLLDRLVDPVRAAVDVGANEGVYSGRLSQLCGKVHAFEPIPWFADALRKKMDPNVDVHQIALSNRDGNAQLRIPYDGALEMHGFSTLETGNDLRGSTHVRPVDVILKRLDDIVREPVGFLKIDVEGHELAVLQGAIRILKNDRPALLIESERRHQAEAPESVFRFLTDLSYSGFFVKQNRLNALSVFRREIDQAVENVGKPATDPQPYINNFIFLPG